MTDEQYVRREMARKTRRIARELEDIAERVRDQAKVLEENEAPDVYAVVHVLVRAVTVDVAQAGAELPGVIRELQSLESIHLEERTL